MVIRKATQSDIEAIAKIYSDVHDAEESGELTIGWARDVYPTCATAANAVARGEMFIMHDNGEALAAAIINSHQDPAYAQCTWSMAAAEDEVCVLHTLVVAPKHRGKHYGRIFVKFYEDYAREHNFKVLRMDTQEINLTARSMYAKLGYREADVVKCTFNTIPDISLVCLEKALISLE